MALWGRLGRGAWLALRGGRRLRQAAEGAGTGGASAAEVPAVETRLTAREGVLLVRYLAARAVLGWLELFFLLKYVVLALGVGAWLLGDEPVLGAVCAVVFGLAAVVQWLVTRVLDRLGAVRRLSVLEEVAQGASVAWWPNLQRELRRVGLDPRPRALLRLGGGVVVRRLPAEHERALGRVDWASVLPRSEWRQARRALAEVAGTEGVDEVA